MTFGFSEGEHAAAHLPLQKDMAMWGRQLFFDPRLSKNSQVSCATCHVPELHFTDGKPISIGLGLVTKNAQSIVNSRFQNWFFWNGRADSLASQTLGPFTHPMEQGLSFSGIARQIRENYSKEYETFFGSWPEDLTAEVLKQDATPPATPLLISPEVAAYVLSTVEYQTLRQLLEAAQAEQKKPTEMAAEKLSTALIDVPNEWTQNFVMLPESVQSALKRVVANVGVAIANYEKNIIAIDSPFDGFVRNLRKTNFPHEAFVDGFGPEEYSGLEVFLKSNCDLCHNGSRLTDDQFHNIGLPLFKGQKLPELGRAEGVLLALRDPFNCVGEYLAISDSEKQRSEACQELDFLNSEAFELVGAFKTPSLRNVAKTAPYLHDGRAQTLDEVLDHYQHLKDTPAIGHREESLQPLNLSVKQREQLKAFLESLSSEVTDLSL